MATTPTHEELGNRSKGLEQENMKLQRKVDELREDHEKYRAIFDHRYNCIYIHDFSGNFLDANDATLNLLGYGRDDIQRKSRRIRRRKNQAWNGSDSFHRGNRR